MRLKDILVLELKRMGSKCNRGWQKPIPLISVDHGAPPRILRTRTHPVPTGGVYQRISGGNAPWWRRGRRRGAGTGFPPPVSMSSPRRSRDKSAGKRWRPISCWKAPTPRRMHGRLQEPCPKLEQMNIHPNSRFSWMNRMRPKCIRLLCICWKEMNRHKSRQ